MEYQDTSWLARLATLLGGTGQPQGSPAWLSHIYTLLGDFLTGRSKALIRSSTSTDFTGSTAERVIATIPVAAGKVSAGDIIEMFFAATYPNSANNKVFRIRVGGTGLDGTEIFNSTQTTTVAFGVFRRLFFPTLATQWAFNTGNQSDTGSTASAPVTPAVDFSVAQNIYITVAMASAAETLTLKGFGARVMKADTV